MLCHKGGGFQRLKNTFLNNLFYFSSSLLWCNLLTMNFLLWFFALKPLPFLVCQFPGWINGKRMVFFDLFNPTGGHGLKVITKLACHSFPMSQL